MDMTKAKLKELARKDGLYSTPYLNDKLFLHYKGFREIANLDEYTGLKVLWLEGNGIAEIKGLENQRELTTLYLHENVIETIEGLEACTQLDTLNLSKNMIHSLSGLSHLKKLKVLQLSHNSLTSAADIAPLADLPSLTTLDLSDNRLEDGPAVLELVASLPSLAVLYLHGNPAVKGIPHYRRTLVARCKGLTYLDDRPVFPEERERCEAWYAAYLKDGQAAAGEVERAVAARQAADKREAEERAFHAFADFVRRAAAGETDPGAPNAGHAPAAHALAQGSDGPASGGAGSARSQGDGDGAAASGAGAGAGGPEDDLEDEVPPGGGAEGQDEAALDAEWAAEEAAKERPGAGVALPRVGGATAAGYTALSAGAGAGSARSAGSAASAGSAGSRQPGPRADAVAAELADLPPLVDEGEEEHDAAALPPSSSSSSASSGQQAVLPPAQVQPQLNPYSGERLHVLPESAEARAAREERMARLTAAADVYQARWGCSSDSSGSGSGRVGSDTGRSGSGGVAPAAAAAAAREEPLPEAPSAGDAAAIDDAAAAASSAAPGAALDIRHTGSDTGFLTAAQRGEPAATAQAAPAVAAMPPAAAAPPAAGAASGGTALHAADAPADGAGVDVDELD